MLPLNRLMGRTKMITIKDLYDIVGNKMANEAGKVFIRNNFPPHIAEQMCDAIDRQESAEHYMRILKEFISNKDSRGVIDDKVPEYEKFS